MKKVIFICSLFSLIFCKNINDGLNDYLLFLKEHQHLGESGNYKNGHIEIVTDINTIDKIEQAQAKRYIKEGETDKDAYEHATVGIVSRDKYWVWLRDAVIFPSGATGTFNRIIKAGSLDKNVNNGVAIIPVDAKGNIILNVMYRHAIRDWVLELPRGSIEKNESALAAAKRELKEETGMDSQECIELGSVTPDSGTVASVVPIYLIKVGRQGKICQDYSEAILTTIALNKSKLKDAIQIGYYDLTLKNKKIRILVKDGYLSSAIILAEQKKII